jgi:FkbM family methyltransferase
MDRGRFGSAADRMEPRVIVNNSPMLPDDFQVFFNENAYALNKARSRHLASLNLDLQGKKVLEVGAGVGLLTHFFEAHDCTILTTDARPQNVREICREYPHRHVQILNLDTESDLTDLGSFDIVFCYGLLHHLQNPDQALKLLASVCTGIILIDVCVFPGSEGNDRPPINFIREDPTNPSQAVSGTGCYPARSWVMEALRNDFGYAYSSRYQPWHPDFDLNWQTPVEKEFHRAIFVGSRSALNNPMLLDYLPTVQEYERTSQAVRIQCSEQPDYPWIQSSQDIDVLSINETNLANDIVHRCGDRLRHIHQLECSINPLQIDSQELVKDLSKFGLFLIERTVRSASLEYWKSVQKERLPFLAEAIEESINTLTPTEVLSLAKSVAVTQAITLFPGWAYNIEWFSNNPRVRIRRAIFNYFNDRSLEGCFVWTWVANLQVNLRFPNDLTKQLFITGCYEPNEFYLLSNWLKPGMTVLDVGANDGVYALFAARFVGEQGCVIAFEPSDREFDRLNANIELNQLKSIQPFKIGLADSPGERILKLAIDAHAGQNTLGTFVYPGVREERLQPITMQTLDTFIQEQAIQQIDVIKVDIEGTEFAFLQGAKQTLETHHPLILIELLEDALAAQNTSSLEVVTFLKSLGYQIFIISQFTGLPIKVDRELGLSPNIVAAHPARSWQFLTDADQTTQREIELEQADRQFSQLNTQFQQLQGQLSTLQKNNHHALQSKEIELAQNQQLVQVLNNRIQAMQSSKFWQIRSAWMQLKRSLGWKTNDE